MNKPTEDKSQITDKKETINTDYHKEGFPIVGVGASAGGLEALQDFFDNMPDKPGVAFVIVQHLSPDYKSFMNELLARHTSIPIQVVTDNTQIEINHIYLIPPKMNMTISRGKLFLKEIIGRHLNLPIDIFFRSLAADQENNAIGIVLSGTGSDGTLGIRAIKESGGVTMAQNDETAKFDGMPKSSVSTGMVDFVLSPKDLAQELVNYAQHPFVMNADKSVEAQLLQNQNVYNKMIAILHDTKNVDFSNYKQNTIIRRLEKRISINRFEKVTDYISYLAVTPKEITALFNDLLIGVTRFFRDEESFEKLSTSVIPEIFAMHTDRSEIRIWVPACSTGEEAYSIAILFKEYMSKNNLIKDIKIFATDIDDDSITYAGLGLYPSNITADVPNDILSKYFVRKDNGFQINENIRHMIIFARHNVIEEPPFSKLDLISCRNMLIYLNIDVQYRILSTYHMCLRNDGYLFLGSSESLGKLSEGFDIINSKAKLFKKKNKFHPDALPIASNSATMYHSRSSMMQIHNSVDNYISTNRQLNAVFEGIASHYLPPSVIIDSQCNIIYTIHDIGKYVHLPNGLITTNLLKMLDKEVAVIVSSLVRRAEKITDEIFFDDLKSSADNTKYSVYCRKFNGEDEDMSYYLISFVEKKNTGTEDDFEKEANSISISMDHQYQERIEELEREVQQKNESLQATVEELETSNEELQSSNEELIASNEELQSTNEELQSVNEELYTVNSEHIKKIEELTLLNADFDNTLRNTNIGSLFLDRKKVIRKVSEVASSITNILTSDIGRPIHHLALDSLYTGFKNDIDKVNDTLEEIEREVGSGSKWYLMRMVPSRTAENAVNGIIITFVEITRLKNSQFEVNLLTNRLKSALEAGGMYWWEWDIERNYVTLDENAVKMIGYDPSEAGSDMDYWNSLIHPDDKNEREAFIKDLINNKKQNQKNTFRVKCKNGEYKTVKDKSGLVIKEGQKFITGIIRYE
jgi:two-component system CheB/CheR fusion protein